MSKHTIKNKIAIVTGSSMGIGKAIALRLLQKQAKVVLNARNNEKLQLVYHEFKALGYDVLAIQGDVSNPADCERMVEQTVKEYGQLDILINNAGISMEGMIVDTDPEVFKRVFEINVLGGICLTQFAIPHLIKSHGSVVFNGSVAGLIGIPNHAAYSISKMALTALVQTLKMELVNTQVHVGLNYVGFVENAVDKTYLNAKGELLIMPHRNGFSKMTPERVAHLFVEGIENRTFIQVLSVLGKLTALMIRYFPNLTIWMMQRKTAKTTY